LHRIASEKMETYGFVAARQLSILAESRLHLHPRIVKNLFKLIYLKTSWSQSGAG
jgi:hypothetical protein